MKYSVSIYATIIVSVPDVEASNDNEATEAALERARLPELLRREQPVLDVSGTRFSGGVVGVLLEQEDTGESRWLVGYPAERGFTFTPAVEAARSKAMQSALEAIAQISLPGEAGYRGLGEEDMIGAILAARGVLRLIEPRRSER